MNERKRLTAADREILNTLFAISSIADNYNDRFKRVCSRVENGWRDFRLAVTRLNSVIEKLLDTIPTEQPKTIAHEIKMHTIHVATKNAGERPKDHWLMTYEDIATLAAFATDVKCFTCVDYNAPCKLRRVLKEIPVVVVDTFTIPCMKE